MLPVPYRLRHYVRAKTTHIREVVRMQEEIGLQAVTDGEYRRAFWHFDFLAGLDGVEMVEVATGIQFSGGAQVRPVAPAVTGRLDYTTDHMVDHFTFVQANTRVTPKQSIPSPTALHYRGGRQGISTTVYPEIEDFFHDLGLAYQKVLAAFARAGCTYLQLDEVYLAYLCDPNQHADLRARGEDPERLLQAYVRVDQPGHGAASRRDDAGDAFVSWELPFVVDRPGWL